MIRPSMTLVAMALMTALPGEAAAWATSEPVACIEASAAAYRLPPAVIVIVLNVEGGTLGRVSSNANGTADIGPMQVNTGWVPLVARHWSAETAATYTALRDDFCANVEAGTWILRQAMDDAHGDFWSGVGFYHSHDPRFKADYLRKVLMQALRLQALSRRLGH